MITMQYTAGMPCQILQTHFRNIRSLIIGSLWTLFKREAKQGRPLIRNTVGTDTVPYIMTAVYTDPVLIQQPALAFCRFICSRMHLR